jgi:hypothetical protein
MPGSPTPTRHETASRTTWVDTYCGTNMHTTGNMTSGWRSFANWLIILPCVMLPLYEVKRNP